MTWSIYGNKYDLTAFINTHPCGKEIQEKTRDMGDTTPLLESCHAFWNKEHIRKHLEEYKIEGSSESTFDFQLYNPIKERHKMNKITMKTPLSKRLYIILALPLYLILKYVSMANQPIMVEVLLIYMTLHLFALN